MPRPAAEITSGMMTAALGATDADEQRARVLDVVRESFDADRALFVRAAGRWTTPEVVGESARPESPVAIDVDALGAAFDTTGPLALEPEVAGAPCLTLALHPRQEGLWCVALARPAPWTPAEQETLARLAPAVTLVLEHALLRQQLGDPDAADSSKAARERFLATLSHELRNPLAPILMWTSTLRRLRPDDPDVQRATQAIEYAVTLARRLIEDLSDVSRLERGKLQLHPTVVDLRDVVRDAVARRRAAIEEARLTSVDDLPSQAVPVQCDAQRLDQVMGHLLGNAIKFTPPGGVVAVSLAARDRHAEVRVSDSGPGLPETILPQLFTPFVQGPNVHGGLGVGLAVSRWLVDLHRGSIEALRQGDRGGATIIVRLPIHAAGMQPPTAT